MRCVEPFVKAGEVYPCGRCLPCKFRSRRIWFHRVLLEASQHDYSAVVTLTYDESSLPEDGQLHADHLRNWLKRYRKRALERYPWRRLRFIACAEYGEASGRPHFHVVLFGQPGCEYGRNGKLWCQDCSCATCEDITDTWGVGACSVQSLDRASAAYVAGYVTRKVLASSSSSTKPFMRMSNRPGIGALAMHDIASVLLQFDRAVPTALGHGGRPMPLGRYLRGKLGEYTSQEIVSESSPEVRLVQSFAWQNSVSIRSVFRSLNEVHASQLWQSEALKEKNL